jgi:hypothetical protein
MKFDPQGSPYLPKVIRNSIPCPTYAKDYYVDPYYLSHNQADIPEVFLEVDEYMRAKYPKPDKVKEVYEVPMPKIDTNLEGPIYCTRAWYEREKLQKQLRYKRALNDAELSVCQLLAQKDMLRIKIGKLNPEKKRDAREIGVLNYKIRCIDEELEAYRLQYEIDVEHLDKGSRLWRFTTRLKKNVKKVVKKVRTFIEDHQDTIEAIIATLIPIGAGVICKLIGKLIS